MHQSLTCQPGIFPPTNQQLPSQTWNQRSHLFGIHLSKEFRSPPRQLPSLKPIQSMQAISAHHVRMHERCKFVNFGLQASRSQRPTTPTTTKPSLWPMVQRHKARSLTRLRRAGTIRRGLRPGGIGLEARRNSWGAGQSEPGNRACVVQRGLRARSSCKSMLTPVPRMLLLLLVHTNWDG